MVIHHPVYPLKTGTVITMAIQEGDIIRQRIHRQLQLVTAGVAQHFRRVFFHNPSPVVACGENFLDPIVILFPPLFLSLSRSVVKLSTSYKNALHVLNGTSTNDNDISNHTNCIAHQHVKFVSCENHTHKYTQRILALFTIPDKQLSIPTASTNSRTPLNPDPHLFNCSW